jgi:hypothetical protein
LRSEAIQFSRTDRAELASRILLASDRR